jgi:hypothetical protein
VAEWIDREIAAFAPTYWSAPLYHDADRALYKALGGGALRTLSGASLLNPLSADARAAWSRIFAARKTVADSNTVGDGTILGGLILVKGGAGGGGGVVYAHAEHSFGEFPEPGEVVAACKAALA